MLKKWLAASALAAMILSLSPLFGQYSMIEEMILEPYCENGPLPYGGWSVELKGGLAPTHYSERSIIWQTNTAASLSHPFLFSGRKIPTFRSQFDIPWQIGIEAAWNATSHLQLFAEYVFVEAKGKSQQPFSGVPLQVSYSDFMANCAYLGLRIFLNPFFCDPCYGSIAPFLGFKGGFQYQSDINISFYNQGTFLQRSNYSKDYCAISAGLQLGLSWFINCQWSLDLNGELVATESLRNNSHIVITNPAAALGVSTLDVGPCGKIVSFPVTLGLRYHF